MPSDDLSSGSAPIRKRPQDTGDPHRPSAENRVNDLDEVAPDAVSPVERRDSDGPVRGELTRDTGAGAAGGHDSGGPGGREPDPGPGYQRPGGDRGAR